MSNKYKVIGSTEIPLLKAGTIVPALTDDVSCFEFGSFGYFRLTNEQFNASAEAGTMLRFDSPFDFPGSEQEAENADDDAYKNYSLFYLAEGLKNELQEFFGNKVNDLFIQIKDKPNQHLYGYEFYLLPKDELSSFCKPLFVYYKDLISKKINYGKLLSQPPDKCLNMPSAVKEMIQNDCAALLGIICCPEDLERGLPLFLLMDGKESWTEADWEGLYLWAEDYAKRNGISDKSASFWKSQREKLFQEISKSVKIDCLTEYDIKDRPISLERLKEKVLAGGGHVVGRKIEMKISIPHDQEGLHFGGGNGIEVPISVVPKFNYCNTSECRKNQFDEMSKRFRNKSLLLSKPTRNFS